jgi:hypothetical protein
MVAAEIGAMELVLAECRLEPLRVALDVIVPADEVFPGRDDIFAIYDTEDSEFRPFS